MNGSRRSLWTAGLVLLLAGTAVAQIPRASSRRAAGPVRADGAIGDWTGTATVRDAKSGVEFSFQNDGDRLWVLAVVKDAKALESLESTGLTVLAGPAGRKKPVRGVLFLVRALPPESYIYWRESQGRLLSEDDKRAIRGGGPREDTFAFAVGARGSVHGPLRRQRDAEPPGFGFSGGPEGAVYEFEIPLASPDLVPGGLGVRDGESVRLAFEWGGAARKVLGTKAARETPPAEQGGLFGVATPAQEFLNSLDSLSRPRLETRRFSFAVELTLADAR
ncbi:MAG: hypothetical protein MUE80_04265 [Acidobacteria bacterium]|jgi:hypothetical protein|nr:hypothetical protein [Acidobacteriota bacterium]